MKRKPAVLEMTPRGLYCSAGDFYLDPWKPVERAVITHGHSDHARWGHQSYLCSTNSVPILKARLGNELSIQPLALGESLQIGDAKISLHPAGHILGSAQVRVEVGGEVWVFTGDYKTEPDPTCEAFELVRCHTFITETTFGLPVYKWRPQAEILEEVDHWWRENSALGKSAVLFAYSLGKAQRILGGLADLGTDVHGPVVVHGSMFSMNRIYESAKVQLLPWFGVGGLREDQRSRPTLVIAPPSAFGTPWLKRFGPASFAFASGWMQVRGSRRRRGVDRGFVLSDHVDWPALMSVIEATGAQRVLTTHGSSAVVSRFCREMGLDSEPLETPFSDEPVLEDYSLDVPGADEVNEGDFE